MDESIRRDVLYALADALEKWSSISEVDGIYSYIPQDKYDMVWMAIKDLYEDVSYEDPQHETCTHRNAYYFHNNAPMYCPSCGHYIDGGQIIDASIK